MRGVTKGEKFYNGNVCLEEDHGAFWLRVEDEDLLTSDDMPLMGLPVTEDELPRSKEVSEQYLRIKHSK